MERSLASPTKSEGDTSIVIQDAMRYWLLDRNSDGEKMKDTEHELGQALDKEAGRSMIRVPVVRGKPAVLG